jgi:hypothetical protein
VYKWQAMRYKINLANYTPSNQDQGGINPLFKASSGWIKRCERRHPCKLRVPSV